MSKNKTEIKSKRLRIVPKTAEEMRAVIERETDEELKQAYTEMLEGMEQHPDEWIWYTDWNIYLKKEDTLVGGIGFKGPANEMCEVEIGYEINADYRRQGYGLEAVEGMIGWAFQNENVFYVMAETTPDNDKSQGLLKKAGFKETGTQGEEGPRFEKERPKSNYMTFYMSIGMCLGMSLGLSLFKNAATGLCVGMGLGVLLGSGMDSKENRRRKEIAEKRSGESHEKSDE